MRDISERRTSRSWRWSALLLLALGGLVGCWGSTGGGDELILATTTSLQDSGLLDDLVPLFERRSGYQVKTIAVGTGQALKMAERGEADVLLAHAPEAERRVLATGAVIRRQLVMYNDFVLVGPPADPGDLRSLTHAAMALRQLAQRRCLFLSRGDESGTHKRERALWQLAGVQPEGAWYQQAGGGMGQTLIMAAEKQAYTLTDRASYLALDQRLDLDIVLEGDQYLLNLYHVMQVNPARFSRVNARAGRQWEEFLLSEEIQARIGSFGRKRFGRSLFIPAGGRTEAELRRSLAEMN